MNEVKRESKSDEYTSDSESGSETEDELVFMTPQQRLREAIKSKQADRKKGVYHEKINVDE